MARKPGRLRRLDLRSYCGEVIVAFTACTQDRAQLFVTQEVVDRMVSILERSATRYSCIVPIYCFMPDHVHLLVQGLRPESEPLSAMQCFKQLSGVWMRTGRVGKWQVSFYDHIVRGSEDWREQAYYVAMNPVRAGLVEDFTEYPFLGAIGCPLSATLFP